jgi:hypothetical protein
MGMNKVAHPHKTSRFIATLIVGSAILLSVILGIFPGSLPIQVSGYVDLAPGSDPVSGIGSEATKAESENTPHHVVHGSLVDEEGEPVRALEVELIPADKTGDARWNLTEFAWSDKSGEYQFGNTPAGEYFVGVHVNDAPDGDHPFATTFYPGVDAENDAERVYVGESGDIFLKWMRLQRLETLTLDLKIQWEDGELVERGNLLFYNPSFPHQGVVGNVAPQFDAGRAQFTLPIGFEYYARAKVDCDAGATIKTIESRPIQRLRLDGNYRANELTFVIPSPKCTLWTPHSN